MILSSDSERVFGWLGLTTSQPSLWLGVILQEKSLVASPELDGVSESNRDLTLSGSKILFNIFSNLRP